MRIEIPKEKEIIVITGPESSGKTTLAKNLSEQYNLPLVNEYARTYLEVNGPEYTFEDLQKITEQQLIHEQKSHLAHPLIICDTDIVTLEIWATEKYNTSFNILDRLSPKKIYLLCKPDIPWEPDPLRENPDDRERLFEIYQHHLNTNKMNYLELNRDERLSIQLNHFSLH